MRYAVVALISAPEQVPQNSAFVAAAALVIALTPFIIIAIFVYYRILRRLAGRHETKEYAWFADGELSVIISLAIVSLFSYFVCYYGTYDVLWSIQHNSLGPSETVQIIAAVGGLTVGVGTSISAIIKACALFMHGRADVVRAKGETQNAAVIRDAIESGKLELEVKPKRPRSNLRPRKPSA
jgi:amino acid transporter